MLRKFPGKSKRLPYFLASGLAFMLVSFVGQSLGFLSLSGVELGELSVNLIVCISRLKWRRLKGLRDTYWSPQLGVQLRYLSFAAANLETQITITRSVRNRKLCHLTSLGVGTLQKRGYRKGSSTIEASDWSTPISHWECAFQRPIILSLCLCLSYLSSYSSFCRH